MSIIPNFSLYACNMETSEVDWDNRVVIVSDEDTENGFLIPKTSAVHSNFLGGFINMGGEDELKIPCQRYEDHILGIVAVYLNHFSGVEREETPQPTELPKPFPHGSIEGHATPFEVALSKQYFDGEKNMKTLLGVLNLANYLQIPSLVDLGALSLAQRFKGKTPEEIKKMFEGESLPVRPE